MGMLGHELRVLNELAPNGSVDMNRAFWTILGDFCDFDDFW